jgi:hypothetical protein
VIEGDERAAMNTDMILYDPCDHRAASPRVLTQGR